jgi:SAM-dependent methyltransferase
VLTRPFGFDLFRCPAVNAQSRSTYECLATRLVQSNGDTQLANRERALASIGPMPQHPRYDAIADFYDTTVGNNVRDPGTRELLSLLPLRPGDYVLDVACGQGRVTRELTRMGCRVLGVDISEALLEKARASEEAERLGIRYRALDISDPASLQEELFDAAVCNFGLSDIDDLDGALSTLGRVLRPDGWFGFSILHPCFPGWDADAPSSWPGAGYYTEGWWLAQNTGFRGKVGANHRMISTYVNALVRHDLQVQEVREPEPEEAWNARAPGKPQVPVYLVMLSRKGSHLARRSE